MNNLVITNFDYRSLIVIELFLLNEMVLINGLIMWLDEILLLMFIDVD